MRKEKQHTINGINLKVTQLGFADGMELLTTLGRLVGPTLSEARKDSSVTAMIGGIIGRLSFADMSSITEKLAKTTRIEREPGRWPVLEPEMDLAGNYDLMLRWLAFALEVNYGDFFAEGGLLNGAIGAGVLSKA